MSIIGKSMNISSNVALIKSSAKHFIDANVHDGEDRSGCKDDIANFSPDELQELIDDLIDYLYE